MFVFFFFIYCLFQFIFYHIYMYFFNNNYDGVVADFAVITVRVFSLLSFVVLTFNIFNYSSNQHYSNI